MKSLNITTLMALLSLVLTSCYSNLTRELEREVRVSISSNMPITVSNTGNTAFVTPYSDQEFLEFYLEGMRGEFQGSKIVVVESGAEFDVRFSQISITESSSTETVNDSTSTDNGTVYELASIDMDAGGQLITTSDNSSTSWSADKSKREKVTNSRNVIQLATGENKDNTVYRKKEFDADEAKDLARKLGRRSGADIVKQIYRALK